MLTKAEQLQQDGYEAFCRGEPRTACPHSSHRTFAVSNWRKGWDRAQQEAAEAPHAL